MPTERLAAQYLRMSTDHQRYSLANQGMVIGDFADANGFRVVRTYQDAGKSGLTTRGRDGLKSLLADVLSGSADFQTVLVLDVSRWGRYQDPDEAAHYEFLCKQAGVQIVYCAEAFEPGATGSIVKQLKRVMAGEYSRELSEKCRYGKRRRVMQGYTGGGSPPYGFRRQTLNSDGSSGSVLLAGERKSRLDQNVRWVWGPPEEVRVVRSIYSLYAHGGLSSRQVAQQLNSSGLVWSDGTSWTTHRVISVLNCELVLGQMVIGKTRSTLGPARNVARVEWIRIKVCRPMVAKAEFLAAQARRAELRSRYCSREMLILELKRLLAKEGRLSASLIRDSAITHSVRAFTGHFGTLTAAYRLVGYLPGSHHPSERSTRVRNELLAGLRRLYKEHGTVDGRLINDDPDLPQIGVFYRTFGSLPSAYAEAGLSVTRSSPRKRRSIVDEQDDDTADEVWLTSEYEPNYRPN